MVDVYWLNRGEQRCLLRKLNEYEAHRWLAMSPEKNWEVECEAVTNFREYLRIPSVQPDVNYGM
jgi:hypothetical protein